MYAFLAYWYLQSAARFYKGGLAAIGSAEDEIAVLDTARNIGKPLFQDYSRQGRVLGVLFRLARIVAGIICFAVIILGYVALYIFWLALPPLCLVSLVGSLIGSR